MADRWMDERDREWRERDWRRSEAYGRGGEDRSRGGARSQNEDRSWPRGADDDVEPHEERARYGFSRENYSSGSNVRAGGAYGTGSYGRAGGGVQSNAGQRPGEQGRYGGEQFRPQDYTRGVSQAGSQDFRGAQAYRSYSEHQPEAHREDQGGRTYGQPNRGRQTYGQDYRAQTPSTSQGEDDWGFDRQRSIQERSWEGEGDRSSNRDLERRYASEMRRPSSGASGGYDYERGYGDAGRSERQGREPWQDRDQERGEGGAGDFLQRAGERISSWFKGDHLMRGSREDEGGDDGRYREDFGRESRFADPGHRGRGPKGYKRSDERISDEVHDRLTDDPWLDASHIDVEVKDGEVTLSGHVDNREAKHRAERLVEDLSGVRHVQNNLRINSNAGFTGAGRGFGSSALEAEMERHARATDPNNNGVSGLSGRTSTGAMSERSTGTATETSVDPKTGQKRQ